LFCVLLHSRFNCQIINKANSLSFLHLHQHTIVAFKCPSFGCPPCDPVIVATVSAIWSVFVIGGSLHRAKNLRMIYLYTKKIQSTL
jgi:hypothetical protein